MMRNNIFMQGLDKFHAKPYNLVNNGRFHRKVVKVGMGECDDYFHYGSLWWKKNTRTWSFKLLWSLKFQLLQNLKVLRSYKWCDNGRLPKSKLQDENNVELFTIGTPSLEVTSIMVDFLLSKLKTHKKAMETQITCSHFAVDEVLEKKHKHFKFQLSWNPKNFIDNPFFWSLLKFKEIHKQSLFLTSNHKHL